MKKYLLVTVMSFSLLGLVACGSDNSVAETPEVVYEQEVAEEVEENEPEVIEETAPEEAEELNEEPENLEVEENVEAEVTEAVEEAEVTEAVEEIIEWDESDDFAEPVVMYAKGKTNIRKGPGTNYKVVGGLVLNDEVSVLGINKDKSWRKIQYKDDVAYVYSGGLVAEKIDVAAIQAQDDSQPVALQTPAPQENQQPAAPPAVVQAPAGVIMIGDSRTCQMRAATGGGNCTWICEYSTRYDWFAETAVPQADPVVGKGTKVVICMGVNDPGSCNSYANLVNQKAAEWIGRGAKVYYVSLNPVDHPYEDKAVQIDNFNATMPTLLSGVKWIDTASVVKQGGFVLEDGIHYDAAGNATIFNMIIRSL